MCAYGFIWLDGVWLQHGIIAFGFIMLRYEAGTGCPQLRLVE